MSTTSSWSTTPTDTRPGTKCWPRSQQHCADAVGDVGMLGRYGGEEFCILLPGIEIDAAAALAETYRAAIANLKFSDFSVTASLGVSSTSGEATSPQETDGPGRQMPVRRQTRRTQPGDPLGPGVPLISANRQRPRAGSSYRKRVPRRRPSRCRTTPSPLCCRHLPTATRHGRPQYPGRRPVRRHGARTDERRRDLHPGNRGLAA